MLITHDEARNLMVALAGISDELAKAALRYLGLFRPGERDLSWARAAKLLGELVPLIQAGEITRKRQSYPCRARLGFGRLTALSKPATAAS